MLQVNVSRGGLPKRAIERARVGRLGVEGDRHREVTVHGGPNRAVCLFGIEAIERLQAEGHPVEPGSVGENLTTSGVDWSTLPAGTRIRVGTDVLLELWLPALPCDTQRPNFLRGEIERIHHRRHPTDSRMYARVLAEGEVRAGDPIELLPPVPGSAGADAWRRYRIESLERVANLRLWHAAEAAGLEVHLLHDGEIAAAAAPGLPGPAFNRASGLHGMPQLLPVVADLFRHHGVSAWLPMDEPLWPGAEPDHELSVLAAEPASIAPVVPPEGVTIRALRIEEAPVWGDVALDGLEANASDRAFATLAPHLFATTGVHTLVAESDGRALGVGTLHVSKHAGLLRGGIVRPSARGRGLQRALIAARAALAFEKGCDLLASFAAPGSVSERNLLTAGFERLATVPVYRFDPETAPPVDAPEAT